MLLLRLRWFVFLTIPMYKTLYRLIFKYCLSGKEFQYFFSKFYIFIYKVPLLRELILKQDSGYCLRITVVPTKNTLREFKQTAVGVQIRKRAFPAKRSRRYHKRDGAIPWYMNYESGSQTLSFIWITSRVCQKRWLVRGGAWTFAFLVYSQRIGFWPALSQPLN